MTEPGAAATAGARWAVTVDRSRCNGSAICAGTAHGRFRVENGKSRPVETEIAPDEAVLDAAESCPWEALTVTDLASGTVLAPEQ
ncbi:ferredoxin [Streptomyces hokutonensis]|uniref:ferredoxin n=1 Tax=Streptomyces hokutonensis TaxID=1306990 RepID=UPI0003625C75|nr:ferredoxin [Streptomyces hokutonensis]